MVVEDWGSEFLSLTLSTAPKSAVKKCKVGAKREEVPIHEEGKNKILSRCKETSGKCQLKVSSL